jgi:glycosyltransferase involved in cell wall biosynthesis
VQVEDSLIAATQRNEFPRVLFVTPHAFNGTTGGGITFSNLFRGWPMDRLATVHDDPEPTTDDVCRRYYTLGPAELDYVWPLGALRRRMHADERVGNRATSNAASTASGSSTAMLKSLAIAMLGDAPPQRARLTPRLAQWIGEFRPQLLYTILGNNAMMDLIEAIRVRFDLPLVVHIMDDWPSSAYRRGICGPVQRLRMQAHLRRFFASANRCLAISDAMADAFEERYGAHFEAFQNTIDIPACAPPAKADLTAGRPADILYVGSIFANAQLNSLFDCAEAVSRLAARGHDVRLTIASPSGHGERYRHLLEVSRAVRVEGPIRDDDAFFRRIAKADLLLLPVNFDNDSVRFIRYSMPTKVPAYLISGTPILAYGPAATAQVAYAKRVNWAVTVESPGAEGLADAMLTALGDVDLRKRLVECARKAAACNHDAAQVRVRFQRCLCELVPGAGAHRLQAVT